MSSLPFVAAVALALVHLFAGRLRFLDGIPRSRWLSGAGGVSVAYVFVHLLPEFGAHQAAIVEEGVLQMLDRHVYLLALVGLVVFYGLERRVRERQREGEELHEGHGLFWIHLTSFALYNVAIGYLLPERETSSLGAMGLYTLAMGLHFVVVDFGLRKDHHEAYARTARWVLAAGILAGWGFGTLVTVPELFVVAITGFLGGGIVLNVLKEELPEERRSRFWAFVAGAAGYAVLLLAI